MNIIRCSKGHFFDKDTFDECPHCRVIANRKGTSSSYSYGDFSRNTGSQEQKQADGSPEEPVTGKIEYDSTPEEPAIIPKASAREEAEHTFRIEALDLDSFVELAAGPLERTPADQRVSPGMADQEPLFEELTDEEWRKESARFSEKKETGKQELEEVTVALAAEAPVEADEPAETETPAEVPVETEAPAEVPVESETPLGAEEESPMEAEIPAGAETAVEAKAEGSVEAEEAIALSAAAPVIGKAAQAVQNLQDLPVGWLVCVEGPAAGSVFVVRYGKSSIGRAASMTISLPGDTSLSDLNHAFVEYDAEKKQFYALPGTSRGLCYVADQLVLTRTPVNNYEKISLGESELMLVQLCGDHFDWDLSLR